MFYQKVCVRTMKRSISLLLEEEKHHQLFSAFLKLEKTLCTDFHITNEMGMMEGSSSSYDVPALEMRPYNIKNGLKDSNTQRVNKNSRKGNFLCKINASFLKNSGKPVTLSHLTSLPTHYSIDPHHHAQLINQCAAILEIIDHALPKALLNRTVHTIVALKDHSNKEVLTNFNILLDRNIRTNYFKTPGYCETSYITAMEGVFEDDAVISW